MRYIGLLPMPPKRLMATVDTVIYGAIISAHPGIDDGQLRAVMPTARDDEQEVDL